MPLEREVFPMLLDREREKQELDRLLAAVREGWGGALVLRGEAGIGKTVLLDAVASASADLQVASAAGIESEMELSFAALHQLLVPFGSGLERLPDAQRRALSSAFGLTSDVAPDRFLVGLAALTLLSDAASEQPVLAVIDDAQWLDLESAAVMAFVARRLYADRIAMVFAVREPVERPVMLEGLAELWLEGLPDAEARELLASVTSGRLDGRVSDRLVSETRGNPLALVELGRELTASELSGRLRLRERLPLGRRLEEHFLGQVRALPADTQTLLLLVSAQHVGDPAQLWRAAKLLGIGPEAADAAGVERLLAMTPRVSFRHPLIRSAVYHGASARSRRLAHNALAAAVDRERDPDRRAWHLADAAVGPDDEVAAELESAAQRARARGGITATARFLTRAAELTADHPGRVRRLLAAADAELTAGAPASAAALLDQARPLTPDSLDEGAELRMRGKIASVLGRGAEAPALLWRATSVLAPLDARLGRETLVEAIEAAIWAGQPTWAAASYEREPIGAAPGGEGSTIDLLLDGCIEMFRRSPADGAPLLRRAVARLRTESPTEQEALRWLRLGCWAAVELLDDVAFCELNDATITLARKQGALAALPLALDWRGQLEVYRGRFDRAKASFAEAREIERATGNPPAYGAGTREMSLLVYRGQETQALEAAAAFIDAGSAREQTLPATFGRAQLCILHLGLGRYAEALECARAAFAVPFVPTGVHLLENLVEAAARAGDEAAAAAGVAALEQRVVEGSTPWALGLLARCRALVAADPEPLYQEALSQLGRCQAAVDLARARLLYGEWLRRQRRRLDARDQLAPAHEHFETVGASPFARRARSELLATGGTARKRTHASRDELTPQELQIALLASHGASNAEIASQLFISESTVAYHLRKVFRKLDVTTRARLARALSDISEPPPAG